jgi:hypothetical protein
MKASEFLETAWAAIAADLKPEHGWYQRRLPIQTPGELHTAILHPSNLRRISILIPRASMGALQFPDDSRGFQIQTETDGASSQNVTAHLRETGTASRELFGTVAADLIEHYRAGSTHADCVTKLWRRLLAWKRFFQTVHGETITRETYVGLFGELTCLNEFLDVGVDGAWLLPKWTGPSGTPQDFSAGETAVEVKTSIGSDSSRVRISGPRQLDDAGLTGLYLYHVVADFRDGAGARLSTLIDATIARLGADSDAATFLRDSLLACGLVVPDTTPWATFGFTVQRKEVFRVTVGFPRLVPATLPPGIVDVLYDLELSACFPFRAGIDDMVAAMNSEVSDA